MIIHHNYEKQIQIQIILQDLLMVQITPLYASPYLIKMLDYGLVVIHHLVVVRHPSLFYLCLLVIFSF